MAWTSRREYYTQFSLFQRTFYVFAFKSTIKDDWVLHNPSGVLRWHHLSSHDLQKTWTDGKINIIFILFFLASKNPDCFLGENMLTFKRWIGPSQSWKFWFAVFQHLLNWGVSISHGLGQWGWNELCQHCSAFSFCLPTSYVAVMTRATASILQPWRTMHKNEGEYNKTE